MKKILLFMSVLALGTNAMAQIQTQAGNFIIDPYAGIPNWANSTFFAKVDPDNSGATDYKVNGGLFSYGGRVEYMAADDFGVGLDINYEVSGFNFNDTVYEFNTTTSQYETAKYNYDYSAKKLRIMVRMNKHFVQNERMDAYFGFAAGYKVVNRAFVTNDPNGINEDDGGTGALVPVAFRIAVGTRVYFTSNIGAHFEIGACGGALLQFGISAKF